MADAGLFTLTRLVTNWKSLRIFSPAGCSLFLNYSPLQIISSQIPKNINFGILLISGLDYRLIVTNYTNELNFWYNVTNLNFSSVLWIHHTMSRLPKKRSQNKKCISYIF